MSKLESLESSNGARDQVASKLFENLVVATEELSARVVSRHAGNAVIHITSQIAR